jgi:hypothetical protein
MFFDISTVTVSLMWRKMAGLPISQTPGIGLINSPWLAITLTPFDRT